MQQGFRFLTEQDLNSVYTTNNTSEVSQDLAQVQIGALGVTEDGRWFKYANLGGTSNILPGTLLTTPALTNNTGLALATTNSTSALSAGSTSLVVVNGSTAVTADQFVGGYLQVNSTTNGYASYRIIGNTAAAASGNITVLLAQSEPLQNTAALVAGTDTVNLIQNPYWAIVPNASLAQVAGVLTVPYTYTSGYNAFAWVQVKGLTNVKVDSSTPAAGNGLSQSATSGTVGTTGVSGSAVIGVANSAKAGGAVSTVLNIAY